MTLRRALHKSVKVQLAESKQRGDGLLALLQLVLESQGGRIAVSRHYDGRPKRQLIVDEKPDRIVLSLGEEVGRHN